MIFFFYFSSLRDNSLLKAFAIFSQLLQSISETQRNKIQSARSAVVGIYVQTATTNLKSFGELLSLRSEMFVSFVA